MKNSKESKWKQEAMKMPCLYKKMPGKEYSLKDDQVAAWISNNSPIMSMVIDKLRQEGLIAYSAETGTWRGRDTK